MIGRTLGHYEITAELGRGGMGEVYRARDTRLGRDVALKTLPVELGADPERVARFAREARSLAALQHPNVASIYGFETEGDTRFLVMELVEGEDLAQRLARGPMPVDEAIGIAAQVAEGLAAAHDKGLVHRDLKPANLMLTPDGGVKILDFGLARAWTGDGEDGGDPSTSPTLTAAMTQAGTILGTAAYMSPEQARGRTADRRADIWALGVVLWEMLTGGRLFAGETVSDTLAAVLTRDPDLAALPAATPPPVRRVLRRCLARDPKVRLRDAGDLRLELLSEDSEAEAATAGGSGVSGRRAVAAVVVVAAVAVAGGLLLGRQGGRAPAPEVVGLSAPGAGFDSWSSPSISDDGQLISWVPYSVSGTEPLRVRSLADYAVRVLAESGDAANPAFSPDGAWIAYVAVRGNAVCKIPVDGGAPQRLAGANQVSVNIDWADDGYIYFSGGGSNAADRGVKRVPVAGGPLESVTTVGSDEGQHLHPRRVPGTSWLLFCTESEGNPKVLAKDLATGRRDTIAVGGTTPRFLAPDILLYFRPASGDVAAVRVDPRTMAPRSDPTVVLDGVATSSNLRGCYDVSRTGRLVYTNSDGHGLVTGNRAVCWAGADGKLAPIFSERSSWVQPRLSPDGRHLVVREVETPSCVLWNYDFARGTLSRITFAEDAHCPVWNPADGKVIFRYDVGTKYYVAERSADGTGPTTTLLENDDIEIAPASISADGRWLVLDVKTGGDDLWVWDARDGGKPQPFADSPFRERDGAISPDGRWIAYASNESGRDEVYARTWPGRDRRQQISVDGGSDPRWARDGRTLYFSNKDEVLAVDIRAGDDLEPGAPRRIMQAVFDSAPYSHSFDVAADGKRVVVVGSAGAAEASSELRVVLGWSDAVKRRLAGK